MRLKDKFDNFLYNDKFKLSIDDNIIEVSNYYKIENFSNTNINISSKNKIYEIKGNDLCINTLFDDYLLIKGKVKSIDLVKYDYKN